MKGQLTTEDLWKLFGDYEDRAHNPMNPEYALVYATMANALARIIAVRESNSGKC
jgi:hypothetical protein